MMLLRKCKRKTVHLVSIIANSVLRLVAIEGCFFENVKIKVTVYCQTFVAMEVFIILEHLVQRKQKELLKA